MIIRRSDDGDVDERHVILRPKKGIRFTSQNKTKTKKNKTKGRYT